MMESTFIHVYSQGNQLTTHGCKFYVHANHGHHDPEPKFFSRSPVVLFWGEINVAFDGVDNPAMEAYFLVRII